MDEESLTEVMTAIVSTRSSASSVARAAANAAARGGEKTLEYWAEGGEIPFYSGVEQSILQMVLVLVLGLLR